MPDTTFICFHFVYMNEDERENCQQNCRSDLIIFIVYPELCSSFEDVNSSIVHVYFLFCKTFPYVLWNNLINKLIKIENVSITVISVFVPSA